MAVATSAETIFDECAVPLYYINEQNSPRILDAVRAAEDADPGRDRQLADTIAAVLIASPFVRLDDITGPMLADIVAKAIVSDFHVSMREEGSESTAAHPL